MRCLSSSSALLCRRKENKYIKNRDGLKGGKEHEVARYLLPWCCTLCYHCHLRTHHSQHHFPHRPAQGLQKDWCPRRVQGPGLHPRSGEKNPKGDAAVPPVACKGNRRARFSCGFDITVETRTDQPPHRPALTASLSTHTYHFLHQPSREYLLTCT